jgi:hypothetical protein
MAEDERKEGPMSARLALAGALAVTAAWLAAGSAAAQEATSAVGPPATCQVAPRSPEELAVIVAVASPVAELDSVDTAADLPRGEPAAAIADAASEYASCFNAADYPRVLALMSERVVRGTVEQWGA